MKSSFLRFVLPLAALAFIAPGSALAQKGKGDTGGSPSGAIVIPGGTYAETYVIDKSGSYVLGGDREMSDSDKHIIEITAPDVTLDLGGFSLSYPGSGNRGIRIPACENVEIRNGTIANGYMGIQVQSGKGLRVANIRVVNAGYSGIVVDAEAAQIDRCQVNDCLNYGIWTSGAGTLVTDCVVNGSGTGVVVNNGSRVVRTVVRGTNKAPERGFVASGGSTVIDCTATGYYIGVGLSGSSTLRNSEVLNNSTGVLSSSTCAIIGSRITNNTQNVNGSYINGGGNIIQ